MTIGECKRFLSRNKIIGINRAEKITGFSRDVLHKFAAETGTKLVTTLERKEICRNAPEICEICPYDECINPDMPTSAETQRVVSALPRMKRRKDDKQEA